MLVFLVDKRASLAAIQGQDARWHASTDQMRNTLETHVGSGHETFAKCMVRLRGVIISYQGGVTKSVDGIIFRDF